MDQQQQQFYAPQQAAAGPPLQHPTPVHPQFAAPQFGHGYPQTGYSNQENFGFVPFQDLSGSAATQLGMQFGKSAFAVGQQYMEQNIQKIGRLSYYWKVNTTYVQSKIRLVLFPFLQKSWARIPNRSDENGQVDGYRTARDDLNAPDHYIPAMAFVTYLLLVSISSGWKEKFHPQVIGVTASTTLALLSVEIALVKLGCYLLNIPTEAVLFDLLAYCGYKYIGVIVVSAVKILTDGWPMWLIAGYIGMAVSVFTMRSMRWVVLPDATGTISNEQRRRRVRFLLLVAAFQLLVLFLLT